MNGLSDALAVATATAAALVAAAGLVAASAMLARTRSALQALPVLLDFLLAAGLLRLVGSPTWAALATAGLVVLIRHVVVRQLHGAAHAHTRIRSRLRSPNGSHLAR